MTYAFIMAYLVTHANGSAGSVEQVLTIGTLSLVGAFWGYSLFALVEEIRLTWGGRAARVEATKNLREYMRKESK